jgi:hypothetical protein
VVELPRLWSYPLPSTLTVKARTRARNAHAGAREPAPTQQTQFRPKPYPGRLATHRADLGAPSYFTRTVAYAVELFLPLAFGVKPTRTLTVTGLREVFSGTSSVTFCCFDGYL